MDGGTQTTETKVIQLFFFFRGMGYHAVSLAQLSCCWTAVLLLNALPPLLLPRKHFCVFSFILLSSYCLSLSPKEKFITLTLTSVAHSGICSPRLVRCTFLSFIFFLSTTLSSTVLVCLQCLNQNLIFKHFTENSVFFFKPRHFHGNAAW